LAKELKQEDLAQAPDSYRCTGLTGSRRWMAPENCLCRHYGLSVDVYSFGLLFWNVMALETPFPGFSLEQHQKRVVRKEERPNFRKVKVAPSLRDMMVRAWSTNPSKRPDFKEICELIQLDICTAKLTKRGKSNIINDRSGHLLDQSMMSWFGGGSADLGL
jgi:serine/threonine protein kinase